MLYHVQIFCWKYKRLVRGVQLHRDSLLVTFVDVRQHPGICHHEKV